jgi:hypothetical protein
VEDAVVRLAWDDVHACDAALLNLSVAGGAAPGATQLDLDHGRPPVPGEQGQVVGVWLTVPTVRTQSMK